MVVLATDYSIRLKPLEENCVEEICFSFINIFDF